MIAEEPTPVPACERHTSVRLPADIKHAWPSIYPLFKWDMPRNRRITPPLPISSVHHTRHGLELQSLVGWPLGRTEEGALWHCGRLVGPPIRLAC